MMYQYLCLDTKHTHSMWIYRSHARVKLNVSTFASEFLCMKNFLASNRWSIVLPKPVSLVCCIGLHEALKHVEEI